MNSIDQFLGHLRKAPVGRALVNNVSLSPVFAETPSAHDMLAWAEAFAT